MDNDFDLEDYSRLRSEVEHMSDAELSTALDAMDGVPFEDDAVNSLQISLNAEIMAKRRVRRAWWFAAGVAAMLVVLLGVGAWTYDRLQQRIDGYDRILAQSVSLETERGDMMSAHLPDGSRVELGPKSVLSYRLGGFGPTAREVTVEGEARFRIAKNADAPFTVHGRGFDVRVLGTTFTVNVRDNSDRAVIHLEEGSISLMPDRSTAVRMHPGQTAVLSHADGRLQLFDDEDSHRASTMKERSFESESLAAVLAEMSLYYDCDFKLTPACASKRFSGVLPADDLHQTLYILTNTLHVAFDKTPAGYTVR